MTRQGENERIPESPTAIGMATGMDVPGLDDVRGTLEEALVLPPTEVANRTPAGGIAEDDLDVVPGQSGAEALADLPNAGADDPWDGP